MNPLEFYNLHMETLVRLAVERESKRTYISSFRARKTITDPFQELSNELIHHVTDYLESKEVFQLRQASMVVSEATSGSNFWIPRIQKDMAWLWVPHDLFRDTGKSTNGKDEPTIDWMKVYMMFDRVTASPFGMSGAYMGLANRRRIWSTCEQLKSLYLSHVAKSGCSPINSTPNRRTWSEHTEIDSLWSEALDTLESYEQWLYKRRQVAPSDA